MRLLYCLYQLFIALPLILVATVLTSVVTVVGGLLGNAAVWGYYPGKCWAIFICRVLLLPVKVTGREHLQRKTSYVFVANHQGAFDIFLVYGFLCRNFKWMMKKQLRKIPFVGIACEKARHIFVDRSSPTGIKETITNARETLKDGMSLFVFPEGSRTYTGRMQHFRKGAFLLADELQLPVVPITIDGPFQVLPRTKKIGFIRRHALRMTIHEPLYPQGEGQSDIKDLMDRAYKVIDSDLPREFQAPKA